MNRSSSAGSIIALYFFPVFCAFKTSAVLCTFKTSAAIQHEVVGGLGDLQWRGLRRENPAAPHLGAFGRYQADTAVNTVAWLFAKVSCGSDSASRSSSFFTQLALTTKLEAWRGLGSLAL